MAFRVCGFVFLLCMSGAAFAETAADTSAEVDYLEDVRPIFDNNCLTCHGPKRQKGMLRLDTADLMRQGGATGAAIEPGDAEASLLIQAVTGEHEEFHMPPEDFADPLDESQIATLRQWIDGGAVAPDEPEPPKAEPHWAFVAPAKPDVPEVSDQAWAAHPVDALLAARHEELGLKPNRPASPEVLIRRVYLDLIGLPPTPEQVRDFVADPSDEAYEQIVDELLASPQYGQRWGRHWMDIWRYSDWYGFNEEIRYSQPHIWRWREWIVESLNADKPYDRMIEEMLAADELAPTDEDALRATGFLARNWFKFSRNTWLDDTVEHTGKAFLGLTVNCARCHTHKYDPISHRDYYRFRAFFEPHQLREQQLPGGEDAAAAKLTRAFDAEPEAVTYRFIRGEESEPDESEPLRPALPRVFDDVPLEVEPVDLPAEAYYPGLQPFMQKRKIAEAEAAMEAAKAALAEAEAAADVSREQRDQFAAGEKPTDADPRLNAGGFLHDPFDTLDETRWEVTSGEWSPSEAGLRQDAIAMESHGLVSREQHPRDFHAKLRFRTLDGTTYRSVGIYFDRVDEANHTGVYVSLANTGPSVNMAIRNEGQDAYPHTQPREGLAVGDQVELDIAVRDKLVNVWVDGDFLFAYALTGERREGQLSVWAFDARAEFIELHVDALSAEAVMAEPGEQPATGPRTLAEAEQTLDQAEAKVGVHEAKLAAAQAELLSVQARVLADDATHGRNDVDAKTARKMAASAHRQAALRRAEVQLLEAEQTLSLARDQHEAEHEAVTQADAALKQARERRSEAQAALLAADDDYAPITETYPRTSSGRRLALARWITHRKNPLTARVAANHIWMRHFGEPLVGSVFDFGRNGNEPTNQPLLDHLAVTFMEDGWSMKALHRHIVTSRAYRMASGTAEAPAANREIDPDNQQVWRQNVRRMEAEIVRDSVLHAAGQLDLAMGGPELDENKMMTTYRRSLYYRHAPDKQGEFVLAFDAAGPTECYRREQSVVPQQALALANSVLTLDQARRLAEQLSEQVAAEVDAAQNPDAPEAEAFIEAAFYHLLGREPEPAEYSACRSFLHDQAELLSEPEQLTQSTGKTEPSVEPAGDPQQRARENLVHVLMNHNDFVTIR